MDIQALNLAGAAIKIFHYFCVLNISYSIYPWSKAIFISPNQSVQLNSFHNFNTWWLPPNEAFAFTLHPPHLNDEMSHTETGRTFFSSLLKGNTFLHHVTTTNVTCNSNIFLCKDEQTSPNVPIIPDPLKRCTYNYKAKQPWKYHWIA